ncbi:hypothetical protein [Nocardiopsis sp. ATB16-24]|nr:hypothetical protein [Nocardiopsis sp. ATB16-24]
MNPMTDRTHVPEPEDAGEGTEEGAVPAREEPSDRSTVTIPPQRSR